MLKIIMSLLLIGCTNAYADGASIQQAEIVRQSVSAFMLQHNVPGVAVALFVDGKPYGYYFGEASQRTKKPVNGKTIFELGSITKLFTSLLLAEEVDIAKVQIDAPLIHYLPDLPAEYEDITLMNLATHTAGLPFGLPPDINTSSKLQKYLQATTPPASAEEKWAYSNVGMGLLGAALEKIEKNNLNSLYRKNILQPLHMQPIGLQVPKNDQLNLAEGYDVSGKQVTPDTDTVLPAAHGIKASAEDMRLFLRAAIGLEGTPEKILYPMHMTEAPFVITRYRMQGLGWQIHSFDDETVSDMLAGADIDLPKSDIISSMQEKPIFDGNNLIDKTGMTNGFRAYIAIIPNKHTGIVILANKAVPGKPIVVAGREILFKLNQIEPDKDDDKDEV